MGIEDSMTALLERSGASKQVLQSVSRLIGGTGLAGLVEQFAKAGHGEKAASWVSTGPNQPLQGHEVAAVLGHDKVEEVAREAGISHAAAEDELAVAIPKVVNELTPQGKVPEGQLLDELVGKLKGLLG